MATSFTKLKNGDWGVRTDGSAAVGQSVVVAKRDGSSSTVIVTKVLWTDGKVSLCAISRAVPKNNSRNGSVCAECGRGGPLVTDLEDGLRKHYRCCDLPPSGY